MQFHADSSVLETLTAFNQEEAFRKPLQFLAGAPAPQPNGELKLPAIAYDSLTSPFPHDRKFDRNFSVWYLNDDQRELFFRAVFMLKATDITVFVQNGVPQGLRITACRGTETAQVVLYHNKSGAFRKALAESPQTALGQEVVRLLNRPLPLFANEVDGLFADGLPLQLVSAYYQLRDGAHKRQWALPWMELGINALELWFKAPQHGLAQVLLHYGPGDAPIQARVAQVQSNTVLAPLQKLLLSLSSAASGAEGVATQSA
ncbi:hypothetical protein BEN47_15350 [Hymenobacter lapidarius]|uniref:Uncharacterized protein n=1 Tax=Hymenobacter lapidarius TaxID=1908237 RepID=A0A1G1T2J6_9BACT|nr:hypothetical protein BEN47_15350 [Hymenobacter lapidarius]